MAAVATALPAPLAAAVRSSSAEKHLAFYNTHTGETLKTMYRCRGAYVSEAIREISWILRDFRTNEIKPIDTGLLDLLHGISDRLETREPLHVISGYRSPATNAELRNRNGRTSGVARHSLHMVGQAADIRIPGTALATLRSTATALKAGGVGYYPDLDFVHVDVGRVRYW